ncbi:MAG: hypothetical protein AAGB15_09465 [Pseudomonadota bacterium]
MVARDGCNGILTMLAEDPATAFSVMGLLLAALVALVVFLRRGTEAPRRPVDDEYIPSDRRDLGSGAPAATGMGLGAGLPGPQGTAPRMPGLDSDFGGGPMAGTLPGLSLGYGALDSSDPGMGGTGSTPRGAGQPRADTVMATGLLGGSMTAEDQTDDGSDRNR